MAKATVGATTDQKKMSIEKSVLVIFLCVRLYSSAPYFLLISFIIRICTSDLRCLLLKRSEARMLIRLSLVKRSGRKWRDRHLRSPLHQGIISSCPFGYKRGLQYRQTPLFGQIITISAVVFDTDSSVFPAVFLRSFGHLFFFLFEERI